MKYWFVQHNMYAYSEHKNLIGQKNKGKISKINKGDKIVYYATGDMVIIGTFKVTSDIFKLRNDRFWKNIWAYKIKKLKLGKEPFFLPIMEVISKQKLKLFPKRKIEGIKLRGRTAIEISKNDFNKFEKSIGTYEAPKNLFKGLSNDEGLGEPKDLGIMRFTPTNEMGVVALFVKHMRKLGFDQFEFIRQGFPDACVYEKTEKGRQRKFIEFEYRSSEFRQHMKNKNHLKIKCDYVVCWEDDLYACTVKVIELKSNLLGLF